MFFDREELKITVFDVLQLDLGESRHINRGRNFCALSFRLKSDAIIKTERSEHRVCDNAIAFFPSGKKYTRLSNEDELIVIHFGVDDASFEDVEVFYPNDPKKFEELFACARECWEGKAAGYKHKATAIIYEILALISAELCQGQRADALYNEKIAAAVEYMTSNYKNPDITVEKIAAASYISDVYFRRLFKAAFGISPRKHLIKLRIEHAKRLIESGYYSIEEVAALSGFSDPKYFSCEFSRAVGVSPSKYKYDRDYELQ